MAELTWDGSSTYYARLENGRVLYVSGDAVAEARWDYIKDRILGMPLLASNEEINTLIYEALQDKTSEASTLYDEAIGELLDSSAWESDAVEVDEDDVPLTPLKWHYDAWIRTEGDAHE